MTLTCFQLEAEIHLKPRARFYICGCLNVSQCVSVGEWESESVCVWYWMKITRSFQNRQGILFAPSKPHKKAHTSHHTTSYRAYTTLEIWRARNISSPKMKWIEVKPQSFDSNNYIIHSAPVRHAVLIPYVFFFCWCRCFLPLARKYEWVGHKKIGMYV